MDAVLPDPVSHCEIFFPQGNPQLERMHRGAEFVTASGTFCLSSLGSRRSVSGARVYRASLAALAAFKP